MGTAMATRLASLGWEVTGWTRSGGSRSLADPDADFTVAATVPAPGDDVLYPLRAYIRGHATGDPAHFREAFLPTAHIEGYGTARSYPGTSTTTARSSAGSRHRTNRLAPGA